MSAAPAVGDADGLRLGRGLSGSWDVLFDGVPIWSVSVSESADRSGTAVPWPEAMRPWLDGWARVELRGERGSVDLGEIHFGSSEERVRFVDAGGIPVVVDKWGIVQRPFTGRGAGVTDVMVDRAQQIIDILAEDCGIHAWMAFGTLLGAAREGGVIGHDSDVDLAYLSEETTPAGVARELFEARRALARRGLRVVNKTATFVTVLFEAPDGAPASVDLYSCFYVDGLLHETATVRAPVPREAIVPLRTMSFEGRQLPAPADPDAMLVASYGPHWRTPDPSFRHQPGPEIVERFNGWFGSVMWNRRDWETYWRRQVRSPGTEPSPSEFATWVSRRLAPSSLVVDVGAGAGHDAEHFAAGGHRVVGLDYARGSFARGRRSSQDLFLDLLNLHDDRDALTRAALLARRRGPRVVYARSLLDALPPSAQDTFWRFLAMVVRGGGRTYLEFAEVSEPAEQGPERFHGTAGRRFAVDRAEVERRIRALGGTVTERRLDRVPYDEGTRRWRIAASWRGRGGMDD